MSDVRSLLVGECREIGEKVKASYTCYDSVECGVSSGRLFGAEKTVW